MIIAVPRETRPGERRVALIPANVAALSKSDLRVHVEEGAGDAAGFSDAAYREAGAEVVRDRAALFGDAGIVAQVNTHGAVPSADDLARLREGQAVVGFVDPLGAPQRVSELAARGVITFSMEMIPRISRAQSMDALSSMATIAGYKAVLLGAGELPQMLPMMMTAAGTLAPAKVFVIGAGVAGLQAAATAKRLGARVSAYDVRPAVREQVESVGASFVELALESEGAEDKGGYAKAQGEDFLARQRELMTRVVADSDLVITTAAIPGKPSPVLVTADMVRQMKPGSVIVDLAAERGGNCELTRAKERVVEHGVVILGPLDIASSVPRHASQMYGKNVATFLGHVAGKGELELDTDDEITQGTLVTRGGRVVNERVRALIEETK